MLLPDSANFSLAGMRALVWGVGAELAAQFSDALAAQGASVITADTLGIDTTDATAVQASIAALAPFQVLISALPSAPPMGFAAASEAYDRQALHVRMAYILAQAVARCLMGVGKPGAIITICDLAQQGAVADFARPMAIELGPHQIRVNTLCYAQAKESSPRMRDDTNDHRFVSDIAGTAAYLASPAGALITGTVLVLDGSN